MLARLCKNSIFPCEYKFYLAFYYFVVPGLFMGDVRESLINF